jgi:hypothetical protein
MRLYLDGVSQQRRREPAMTIRKTASGQVTGTDQGGLARTGSRDSQWEPGDEDELAAENAAADQPGEDEDGPLPVP